MKSKELAITVYLNVDGTITHHYAMGLNNSETPKSISGDGDTTLSNILECFEREGNWIEEDGEVRYAN
tara:strand:- start:443 stop:646 length:204 start_codon:yes stop_codon:yes gene_type:complete